MTEQSMCKCTACNRSFMRAEDPTFCPTLRHRLRMWMPLQTALPWVWSSVDFPSVSHPSSTAHVQLLPVHRWEAWKAAVSRLDNSPNPDFASERNEAERGKQLSQITSSSQRGWGEDPDSISLGQGLSTFLFCPVLQKHQERISSEVKSQPGSKLAMCCWCGLYFLSMAQERDLSMHS